MNCDLLERKKKVHAARIAFMIESMTMRENVPSAEQTSFFKSHISLGRFCEIMAILSLACIWLGSLGRYGWFLDLLSHFRLQYMVVCVVVLLLALIRRRTWLVFVTVISLLWNLQIVYAFNQTADVLQTTDEKPLRVMTFNVMFDNDNHVAVIEHVMKANADIVCLLETDETWRTSLEPLRVKYPYRFEGMNEGKFGIACFTRLPMKSSELKRFTVWGLPTLLLTLDHLGRRLTFIGTHPMPPIGGLNAHEWRSQLSEIGSMVSSIEGEVIVAGDFNATPWCEGMRLLCEKSGLQFRSVDPVWPPTWGLRLPMMISIDHVLVKGGLTVRKREIGPDLGSDHRPVLVEIVR